MRWCKRIRTVCYIWGCAHLQSRAVWCHWRDAHTASPRRVGTPMNMKHHPWNKTQIIYILLQKTTAFLLRQLHMTPWHQQTQFLHNTSLIVQALKFNVYFKIKFHNGSHGSSDYSLIVKSQRGRELYLWPTELHMIITWHGRWHVHADCLLNAWIPQWLNTFTLHYGGHMS